MNADDGADRERDPAEDLTDQLCLNASPRDTTTADRSTQQRLWTVPLAFTVMVAGSLLTRGRVPADVGATMLAAAHPGSHVKETLRNACSAS